MAQALFASAAATPIIGGGAEARSSCAGCFEVTAAERTSGILVAQTEYPWGDIRRYGARPNTPNADPVDNTSIVQQVFNMVRLTGGTIVFPGGDWSFYLDVSWTGSTPPPHVIIDGSGATFRCFDRRAANSCIVYGNNSKGNRQFLTSNLQFNNCNFDGRRYGVGTRGDLNYAVFFNGTAAVFSQCSFQYAVVSGFYAMYGQYNEFWSCLFGACTASAASTGCTLDSDSTAAASNEVFFSRCKFFTCSNFLSLRGCFLTRIRDTTFQGAPSGGRGGIILDADNTGQGCVGTLIDGCWFEINQITHILGTICQATRINANCFLSSGGTNRVIFEYCYDLEFTDNAAYTPIECRISHGSGDSLVAALTWRGNNFVPQLAMDHSGPSYLDVQCAALGTRRNDNVLLTTGQRGEKGLPLVQTDQYGFRTAVHRDSPTPLFRLNLKAFGGGSYAPVLILDIQLFAWQDTAELPTAYASCARGQRFYAFITNNSEKLASFLSPEIDGADLGVGIDSRSLGTLTMVTTESGSIAAGNAAVTFSVSFAGAGLQASQVTSASIGYKVTAMGANEFTMTRL
jgi:hypothetical protein